jgi:hypothetical protein
VRLARYAHHDAVLHTGNVTEQIIQAGLCSKF